ncbi:spindle defective 2 isoform X3 [Megachile rotundata]|uniref:spindle defective 2 isoform X3 n=1 Tax=Megachile rotundata TaxID=143995 RepID=UPI003FD25671
MFTPSKLTEKDFFDATILNTPQPQATSTVQRKSTLESHYIHKDGNEAVYKQLITQNNDKSRKSDESSLGIINNISSLLAEVSAMEDKEKQNESKMDAEREIARRLLQRCSDLKPVSNIYDTNKENNANIQNLSPNTTSSTHVDQEQSSSFSQSNSRGESTLHASASKTNSVVFEPNEISARSSGLSRSSEKCRSSTSSKNVNAITFDTTTAELMAQFNNEEFHPASEMASRLLADEVSWQQNYSYALPTTTSAEKEYLNLSCFSGIIGELDLSVESCAGHKVSVDEFFRRKCGNFGELSDNAIARPSLGLSVTSPKKKGQLIPLVDSTMMTEESSVASYAVKDNPQQNIPNTTKDIEEQSIMSLTSIAQALQDIDNGTPRRLVDQLIMAKKKKKPVQVQEEIPPRDTYTLLPSNRKSMPATPSRNTENFEKDIKSANFSAKLSLDSKIATEMLDVKHSNARTLSFSSNSGAKTNFDAVCQELKKEISSESLPSSYSKEKRSSPRTSKVNMLLNQEKKTFDFQNEEVGKKETVKEENISYKEKSENSVQDISNLSESQSHLNNVVIGKNTEELCNCIVGMIRETDIELINKSDRWIICSLSVNQVQGDKHNVRLTLPKDVILIKPNSKQHAKITVTIVKMSKPIIAVLNITVSDMVTRYEWIMKHIICFKPEEFDISILNPPEKKDLDFQCVVENSITILPITIKNKNNVDVPIKFSLLQEEPSVFSLETLNESQYVMLKPQEVFTTNIKCKGILKQNTEAKQQSLQRHCGNLIIQAGNNSESIVTIGTVPLVVQVGTCKIQVIDTELPLVVPCKQSKPLTVINLGTTPVLISASFVQDNDSVKSLKYFSLQPENLLVQPNETGCFFITYKQQNSDNSKIYAKIKLTAANNVYHYSIIGESNPSTEAETDHLRCETPQYSSSASSPSSPHSITSNKSGNCGRNSPISTVSGSTVAGDKIPIRTTHAALVWSSIKTGKSDIKEFTIRNTSNNKIRIQAVISDSEKNFRFLRERQAVGTIVLILQGLESRTLSVVFGPHHLGAATGKIIFRHYEPRKEDESRPSKVLFLYGYGGYSKVEISEAFKDTSGKMWLSLGTLNSGGSLKAKIKLQNTGDLCSYAKIKLTPKAVYPTMVSSWQVNPSELLLSPKETQWVTLEFYPRKEDIALLQRSDVSHVGTILITHGDEPTRWRIRRLYNKMKETGELSGTGNEAFRNIIHPICIAFRGEQLISDVSAIRDSVQNLGDLCRGIRQHEILLTMEAYADETLSILHDNADESQMFYSLCSDNSHIYEGSGESFLPSETFIGNSTLQSDMNTDFMVHPSVIILTPPSKTEATVTVKSSCIVAQPFETCLSNTEYLSVVPAEGMIPTRRDFQLKIQCKRKIERNFDATLEIYTENNKFDVQIKVNVKRL